MNDAPVNLLAGGLGTGLSIALVAAVMIAILAPLIMSMAAKSAISTITTIAILGAAAGVVLTGKTVVHEVLAAVLYLAALLSAATIYAGSRIEQALRP